jgi:hypothetical protein
MIALALDNVLFLLLIAAAALFQLLSKVLSKASKNPAEKTSTRPTQEKQAPIRKAPAESDADRVRKFLEALGQPPSSTPPPPVVARTDIPPRPLAPVQPPPLIPGAWRLPRDRRQKPPEQPARVEKSSGSPLPAAAVSPFDVHEVASPLAVQEQRMVKTPAEAYGAATPAAGKKAELKADIATLLASQSGLRKAVMLREIFGPPRGLREPDAAL